MSVRPSRLATLAVLTAAAIGCGPRKPTTYGDVAVLRPSFALRPNEKPLQHFTVSVAQPASIAMFYVVPGIGARLVYPTDSTTDNTLQPGAHELVGRFPRAINRDSLFAARQRGRRPPPPRQPRDTTGRTQPNPNGDYRVSNADSAGMIGMNTFNDQGYLLLVTSPSRLSYSELRRHIEGITIPAEDDGALNTIVKLARATLPEGSTWAAFAREVELP